MARRRITVQQLAKEAQLDEDETLIALWDAGYDNVIKPTDSLKSPNQIRRSLGIATRRELKSIAYWMSILDVYESEFRDLLKKLSISLSENAQVLPSKAISRLKSYARKRGIDPITGKVVIRESPSTARKEPPFIWRMIGHPRKLRWLDEDEILSIHLALVDDFSKTKDPIVPPGPRDNNILASAAFRPHTALGNTLKYPTVEMSAAALLHSIVHDHPFHNGNKRTALVSALVFLDENGFFPEFDEDRAFKLVLDIAQHRVTNLGSDHLSDREVLAIAEWFRHNCRILEKGDHPITLRKLRQILTGYDCNIDTPMSGRINITRTVTARSLFVLKKQILRIQIAYHGEGNDVAKDTIKAIRKSLHLDDSHGVDSYAFYAKEPVRATDFINRYRKTLERLARF